MALSSGGADTRLQGIVLLVSNLNHILRGSLLMGSHVEELMDELRVICSFLKGVGCHFVTNLGTLLRDVLGDHFVDLLL